MIDGETEAVWRHVAPFVVWVAVMCLPMSNQAFRYGLQVGAGGAVLLFAQPWRYYPPPALRHLPLGLLVGAGVFFLWVFPESPWMKGAAGWFYDLYARTAVRQGPFPSSGGASPYAPECCGWFLSLIRLGGSALVIAVAEEYFWRGFLMRWLQGQPFTGIDPRRIGWGVLMVSSCLFGLEHSRWLAGVMAGTAYAFLYRRTGDLGVAVLAHGVTNGLLGLYVLITGSYQLW